ncbi:MAG: Ig-like domain-containing protein [Candidatus Scalindua sp.]|nr:Ig-like domain-containing protein [Candidatus Scalindua sp.]
MLKKTLSCKHILFHARRLYFFCSPHFYFTSCIVFLSITFLSIPNGYSAQSSIVPVTWIDTVGVSVNDNSITKTASTGWGNGGAASLESFTGNGGVEFTASAADASANGRPMCGLSSTNRNASYNTIEYAIYLRDTGSVMQLRVYEKGRYKGTFGTYQVGDFFKVERIDSTITYKKNNEIFYTSSTPSDLPLLVDTAIYNTGGEISNVKVFVVAVSNQNRPPVLDPLDDITINEGDTISFNPSANDPDGDTLTFSYSGWMTSNSYATNYQDSGVHTVTVTVSDGFLTDSQDVTVTVNNLNRAPMLATISSITVNEGDTITLSPTATDPDGDTLTFNYSGWMTSNSYATNYQDSGVHSVTVTVSDGSLTDSQDVTVTVNNLNRAPVLATISSITVNVGDTVTLNPTATDPDGDTLTFNYAGWMTLSSYTTNHQDAGVHTVTVTVSDGTLTDTKNVTVTVNKVNRAPVLATISPIVVNEGGTVTFNPTATDPDGDTLSFTYSGWMTSSSYTTSYNDAGDHTVTVTVSDGELTDSQTVMVTVNNVNRAPSLEQVAVMSLDAKATLIWDPNTESNLGGYKVHYGVSSGNYDSVVNVGNQTQFILPDFEIGATYYFAVTAYDTSDNESSFSNEATYTAQEPGIALTINEGDTVTITPTATDPDGDTLNFSYSGWMTSSSYTTSYQDAGTHTVTVTVSDGTASDSREVTVTVVDVIVAVNSAPVLNKMADITVNEGDTISFNPTATDPDEDVLTYSYEGWMTSSSYTTNHQDAGVHTVTVTVSDGTLTDTQDVTVTVNNVNRAPVLATISSIAVNEGVTITLNPSANDPDGDTVTFSYSGWMTSSTYTTTDKDAGVHTVTVTVSDGELTDAQNVTITVLNTNSDILAWDPNTEGDLAGYRVHYGVSSGNYDTIVDVGNQTSYTISGLISGTTYYFAVTAYNISDNESIYSNEVSYNAN